MLMCNMVGDMVEDSDLNHSDSSRSGGVGNMDDADSVGSFVAHKGGKTHDDCVRGLGCTTTPHLG